MPRVHSQKAAKDYPNEGIRKGDVYYKWSLRPGGRGRGMLYRSKEYPKPWQLTSSPFLQQQYQIEHAIGEVDSAEDAKELVEQIRELGEEAQGSLDNMPESLQYSPTGELLEERANACEEWASELESAIDDYENVDEEEDEDGEELESRLEDIRECTYPG